MSVPSWCRVGQRVVCVDDTKWSTKAEVGFAHPKAGEVFTISALDVRGSVVGITFIEKHPNDVYRIDYFRPIATSDDEIEAKFYRTRKDKNVQRIPHFGPVS